MKPDDELLLILFPGERILTRKRDRTPAERLRDQRQIEALRERRRSVLLRPPEFHSVR